MTQRIYHLTHDPANDAASHELASAHRLTPEPRFLKEGLPDGDCRALVVDLDSVAPERRALQRLVKELSERLHPYPVAVFSYSLEDDQILELRAAGIQVFPHGLCPAMFTVIAVQSSDRCSDGLVGLSSSVVVVAGEVSGETVVRCARSQS
jgi:hypothetical protein